MSIKQNDIQIVRRAVGLFLFLALYCGAPQSAHAQNEADLDAELATDMAPETTTELPTSEPMVNQGHGDEIIVERMKDNTLPYKQHRGRWGVLFSMNYEKFNPENYNSLILNNNYATILDGKSIPLVGAEFGVKYNFQMGSVAALVGYAKGQVDNEHLGVKEISMSVTKLDFNFALDNIFDEPYIVPYAQAGMHTIDWTEKGTVSNVTSEESFKTDWNMHYKVGIGFQLNWIEKSIDPSSHEDALRSSGLENTYLDVFYTSYSQPAQVAEVNGSEGEADLASSEIGVGLKLEF